MLFDESRFRRREVLVTALNWGLGHATRCIPLIRRLRRAEAEVTLAAAGEARALWHHEFSDIEILTMPEYEIRYPTGNMMWNLFWQGPKILGAIWREHRWLARQQKKRSFDFIISDNCFGCFHAAAHTIFLTHQLNIQTPFSWSSVSVNVINHYWIRRFDEVWVPDYQEENNLSGKLSHGKQVLGANLPPIKYIGPLSRFSSAIPIRGATPYTFLLLLSGPEPQRSYLERELLSQVQKVKGDFLLVQGKTEVQREEVRGNVRIVSFMTAEQLREAIANSEVIVCRSGYSSIMDLVALNKKAILIPTPGQTEQEYLGRYLGSREQFLVMKQGKIDLQQGLDQLTTQEKTG